MTKRIILDVLLHIPSIGLIQMNLLLNVPIFCYNLHTHYFIFSGNKALLTSRHGITHILPNLLFS